MIAAMVTTFPEQWAVQQAPRLRVGRWQLLRSRTVCVEVSAGRVTGSCTQTEGGGATCAGPAAEPVRSVRRRAQPSAMLWG